jgi:hypothetical protein
VDRGLDDDLMRAERAHLPDVGLAVDLAVALSRQGGKPVRDDAMLPLAVVRDADDLGRGQVLVAGAEGAGGLEERKVGARMSAHPGRASRPFRSEDHPPSGRRILS